MKPIIFFSVNDFTKTSGGTIRIYGILNALAKNNNQVTFISNTKDYSLFHPNITHIYLNHPVNAYSKRKFQFLLAFLPLFVFNTYYHKLLNKIEAILSPLPKQNIFFFEYLDNSIGYWLFKNNLIKGYINDIHGISTEEFKVQLKKEESFREKIKLKLKIYTSKRLDKKVFSNARKIIVPTKSMNSFFSNKYPLLKEEKNIILPNVLQKTSFSKPDSHLAKKLRDKFKITKKDKILLFAGGLKSTSGILDLINAFHIVHKKVPLSKLLIIGDGPLMESSKKLVGKYRLQDRIHFIGQTKHKDLKTYQSLADLLICPDQENIFSNLIIHYKYIDALLANKVVINGNFKSVLEINKNEQLSLGFKPSDINDLANVIIKALSNYNHYKEKYAFTQNFVLSNMTYKEHTKVLENES